MVIHLEFILLRISSNLPALLSMRKTSQSLFDLAPDGVYRSNQSLDRTVVSYTTFSPLPKGGIFSVALSILQFATPPVRGYPVLWCSDFPLLILQSADQEQLSDRLKLKVTKNLLVYTIQNQNKGIVHSFHMYAALCQPLPLK